MFPGAPSPLSRRLLLAALAPLILASTVDASLPGVRSIRITNTRADWFYLEELRIPNENGVDVASLDFGATASASENPGFFTPLEGAIDDLRGPCCDTGWHSSSSAGQQSYTVTLPETQTLAGDITVWDREETCCFQRLDGMLFEFFDGPDGQGSLLAAKQVDLLASDSLGDIHTEKGASFPLPDADADSDGDGLVDRYEQANGLDPLVADGPDGASGDPDEDGSPNLEEFQRGTNPQLADTDEDGLLDGAETATGLWISPQDTGTDPLNPDSDGDTLLDGWERHTLVFASPEDPGTDPNSQDTDGDGIRDQRELFFATDPNDPTSKPAIAASVRGVHSVRITNQLNDWFYLEEIELFNTGDRDVFSSAFGTTATASEAPGFGAQITGPIDDIRGPCCANGYHSSTDQGLQVLTYTFPAPQDLAGDIRFWNRVDGCCASRMDDMLFEFFAGEDGSGERLAAQRIQALGSERNEEVNAPEGAAVPLLIVAPSGPLPLHITALQGQMTLQWPSHPIEFFALETSPTLTTGTWVPLASHLPADPPPAETTVYPLPPTGQPAAFYRLRRVPPPPILSEDFESETPDWKSDVGSLPFPNQGQSRFQRGTPTAGPGAAHGGSAVFATNLTETYDDSLNLTLTSPVVDLSRLQTATLRFWYVLDTGPAEGVLLEFVANDPDQTLLAQTEPLPLAQDWTEMEIDLTEIGEAGPSLAGQSFHLRFRFLSDDNSADNGAGFYLDDLLIVR